MNNFKIWLENEESKEILHMEIPMPQDIIILNEIFKKYHKKLYAVGGVVRDHLISHFHLEGKGDGPKDVDLTTDATPEEIRYFAQEVKVKFVLADDQEQVDKAIAFEIADEKIEENDSAHIDHIIYADPTSQLEANIQENKLPNMTKENKQLIEKVFTKTRKFDCISAMFSLHYFFDKKESIDNLIKNIKDYLIEGGYLIFTLFDAKLVMEKLGESNKYTTHYTDDTGTRRILFDIVKKFEGPLENKEGQPIDVFLDWIMEDGKYQTEYLVTPELLDQVMERAGCRLIESDTFLNIYTFHQ
jgi:SAM-dependent methyltransferase